MSEQGCKILQLADHPSFRHSLSQDPEPEMVEIEPGVFVTLEEQAELRQGPQPDHDTNWAAGPGRKFSIEGEENLPDYCVCEDCPSKETCKYKPE
jgi:hypothetical protein